MVMAIQHSAHCSLNTIEPQAVSQTKARGDDGEDKACHSEEEQSKSDATTSLVALPLMP